MEIYPPFAQGSGDTHKVEGQFQPLMGLCNNELLQSTVHVLVFVSQVISPRMTDVSSER
jgi:hypothetical protein